mgnify:FL=1
MNLTNVSDNLTIPKKQKELLLAFFQSMNSINTMKSYMNDINKFRDFLRDNHRGVWLTEVSQYHISAYKQYLSNFGGRNLTPSTSKTINRKLASLSAFYTYLKQNNAVKSNPVKYVKRPKVSTINHTVELSEVEVEKFFREINTKSGGGKLHFAICSCLFFRGMRRNEVINLKIKDFYSIDDIFVLDYTRKGGLKEPKKISLKVAESIIDWLDYCKDNNYSLKENDFLFRPVKNNSTKELNKSIHPSSVDYIVKKYASKDQ